LIDVRRLPADNRQDLSLPGETESRTIDRLQTQAAENGQKETRELSAPHRASRSCFGRIPELVHEIANSLSNQRIDRHSNGTGGRRFSAHGDSPFVS